jgi:S1/P1 Nuclease
MGEVTRRNATLLYCAALLLAVGVGSATVRAWGTQGHRLVALVATNHLSPTARQNIVWLLGTETLADVAAWADQYLEGNNQTASWHFVNIPPEATTYNRDRDCPRQPGVGAGARGDRWRDCVVDRITYNRERLADASLDRADRAIALKFLVHLIGDLHQPFHALGVERGGNGIPVSAFGSTTCVYDDGTSYPCHLHGIWDTVLIAHRQLSEQQYLAELERAIKDRGWDDVTRYSPADWAMESHRLADAALLLPHSNVDDAYYRTHIPAVDAGLALAALRLAAVLNESLSHPPPG